MASLDKQVVKNFIAGGVGGISTVIIGHPFDTIKVRLQTMPRALAGSMPIYNGMLDCFKKTVAEEGSLGLYKGMAVPILGVAPCSALFFAGCVVGKWLQQKESGQHNFSFAENFQAGSLAGIFSSLIVAPGERIKCILQSQAAQFQSESSNRSGPIRLVRRLYREGGLRNIYRGTAATLLRDIPSLGTYLAVYEHLKAKFSSVDSNSLDNGRRKISPVATIMAGGFAGMACWMVCIPADVVKSRIQTAPYSKGNVRIWSVCKAIYYEEGLRALYKGFVPIMIRAFPANAACFLGLETTLWMLRSI